MRQTIEQKFYASGRHTPDIPKIKYNLNFFNKRRLALLEEEVTRVKERLHENIEKCKIIEAAGHENEEVILRN